MRLGYSILALIAGSAIAAPVALKERSLQAIDAAQAELAKRLHQITLEIRLCSATTQSTNVIIEQSSALGNYMRTTIRNLDAQPELGFMDAMSAHGTSHTTSAEIDDFSTAIIAKKDVFAQAGVNEKLYRVLGENREVIDTMYRSFRNKLPWAVRMVQQSSDSSMLDRLKKAEAAVRPLNLG